MRELPRLYYSLLLLLPFLLLLAPTRAAAQDAHIEGRVTDALTGKALPGVNVTLKGTTRGGATDKDGAFAINDLAPGRYTVIASFVGYETATRQVVARAGETTRLDIALAPEATMLSEITVVGTPAYRRDVTATALRTATPLMLTARSVTSVTDVLLDEQGALTIKDLYRNVAGLNEFAFNNDVTLRGFRMKSTTLYNGLRGNPYGMFHLEPKLTNVDHIDVLKGPAGVLYGALPPGGLINVVTKRPQMTPYRSVELRVGSFDLYNVQAHLTGPITEDNTLLYRADVELERSGHFRDNMTTNFIHATGALTWHMGAATQLTFEGALLNGTLWGRRARGIPFYDGNLFAVPISYTSHEATDFFKNQVYYGEVRFDHRFAEDLRLNAAARYYQAFAQEEYHEPDGIRPDTTDFDGDGDIRELIMKRHFRTDDRRREGLSFNTNLIWNAATGPVKHTLLVGGDVLIEEGGASRYQRALSTLEGGDVPPLEVYSPQYHPGLSDSYRLGAFTPEGYVPGAARQYGSRATRLGVYVQDQVQIGRLYVLGALRYDHFDDEDLYGDAHFADQVVTGRGGVLYALTDDWSVYASYGQGYQPQSAGVQDPSRGGPFDPMRSWQVETGVKAMLFGGRLRATVAGYRIVKENVLVGDPADPFRLIALGEVRSRGIEVELFGSITDRWQLTANYAYNDIEITRDNNPDFVGQPLPNAPAHQGALWTSYTFLDGAFSIAGGPTYVSERATFNSPPVLPAYVRLDVAATYRREALTLRVNVENLTDERYFLGGYGGSSGGLPGAPRNVMLTVAYSF